MNSNWFLLVILLSASVFAQEQEPDVNESDVEQIPPESEDPGPVIEEQNEPTNQTGGGGSFDDGTYDPMISNIAPPDADQRGFSGVPYTLTEARLAQIRSHFMYPFFDRGGGADDVGDYQREIQTSSPQVHKNLNFQLPFFGFRFNYTRVSINGYLEFSDPPPNYQYPLVFPMRDWPRENDPSFIGIFFSKCRIGNLRDGDTDRRPPGVYFRMERDLRTRQDQMGVEIRERVRWDMREGVIGSDTFDAKHVIIVTWKNVSFNGGFANALYQTNTFQMVLATDEVFTYAMFNYLNIDWTSHTEAGGDTRKGEGGVSAYVGFNAGNGTRSYEYKPYSQESVIRDLTGTGFANGFKGRHLFRIDENILMGSCNRDIDGANLPLKFAPESGNMLGGTVVNITGPCFMPDDQIRCKFDVADIVNGYVVDQNRAICVQPPLFVEGYVRFEISVGPGVFKWKGQYFVESPAMAAQKIYFRDTRYHERSPSEIRFTWERQNLTTNENANIRISLWGYREPTIRPTFLYITTLAENVQNTGEYTIIPSQFRQRNDEFLTDLRFGFIQINLTESIRVNTYSTTQQTIEITPVIWSRPIPLGWYFQFQWENMFGRNWPSALCDDWLRTDRFLKNFAHELPQCPCTIQQALADKGKFMPDFDCDKDSNPQCFYNNQAIHCVRTGIPTIQGSEQQCCYDRNGFLMLSYDQQWGSSPRRSHNLGVMPFNEATKVPTLSQWFNDVVPRYLCCLWQDEQAVGCETLRFERRPTQDCVAYQAPGIAGVYGDPHFVTFDDVEYTFNGKGEFVLVRARKRTDNLEVQGRFEQMDPNAYGEVRATQLTSIAARGNSSTVIEVRRRPMYARWRYRLDVIANGRRIFFDRPPLKFQRFPGVTVYTPTYILNQSEVIMMFDNGAGVEVVENEGFMTARIYLPWTFINKTVGLLGNWSFNQEDDFTLPDGNRVSIVANINDMERVYNDFGSRWIVTDVLDPLKGRSLFHREFGRTSSTYNNISFRPQFLMMPEDIIPANRSHQIERTYQICSTRMYECFYDYAMTLDRDLAHFTQNYKATIYTLKETTRTRVISCGILETPRFGRKSTFLFIPGTVVSYDCNQDFILIGDTRRTCLPDGSWNIPDYGYTFCLRAQEYSARQAAIAWGIVLAVIIPLVVLILFIAYKVYQRFQKSEEESDWQYDSSKLKNGPPLGRPPSSQYSDDEEFSRSPVSSDKSDTASSILKKRRSYDKSYRTHEPLKNRPDVDFEEKPWDPNENENENDNEYEPETKPLQSRTAANTGLPGSLSPTSGGSPTSPVAPRSTTSSTAPRSPTNPREPRSTTTAKSPTDMLYSEPFSTGPDVVKTDDNKLTYGPDDYAVPLKKVPPKDRFSSQSSIVTDV